MRSRGQETISGDSEARPSSTIGETMMLPRTIPCLTDKQWTSLEEALDRGPTPEMRERLKKAIERAKKIKRGME
jgi:hypothetical protein